MLGLVVTSQPESQIQFRIWAFARTLRIQGPASKSISVSASEVSKGTMAVPPRPKIYHITHVDNLPSIVADGALHSDRTMIGRRGASSGVGIPGIKERRLELPVRCHPGDFVGDFVPFNLCPRSIMLYVIHMANHPNLEYRGGQSPIVHLEADLKDVVLWADSVGRHWALSVSNAGAIYSNFRSRLADLVEIDWKAVNATDFRLPEVKEGKQAEFLIHESFPWELVTAIGVFSSEIKAKAEEATQSAPNKPPVRVRRDWYY
ncbi:MAG: DUF4433 domain-containing protein [Thermoanaerobaculia bacterium]